MTDLHARADLTGRVLMNKLRVVRLLGEGGMGAVYEVEHLITRHRRALKVMHGRLAANAETIARFIREAGVAGTLRTPYVVETFDAGQLDDGSPYVLMELLEGRPMSALFDSPEPLAVGRLVGLMCQVLEGLAVAHRAGIVHRDVKPDNIFVGIDERGLERVRILDFGISKFTQGQPDYQGTLTAEGAMMGTPYYMSPEQALGAKDLDERSDLYSVGVMLYEGLARRRPYEGQTLAALILKIHHGDHPRLHDVAPGVGRPLADTVERALSVSPSARFASAEEMLAALVQHSDSQYVTSLQTLRNAAPQFAETLDAPVLAAAKAAPAPTVPSTPAGSRAPWAIGLGVVAAVAIGIGVWALSGGASEPSTVPVATEHAGVEAPMPTGVLPPSGTGAGTETGTETETETESETETETVSGTGTGTVTAAVRPSVRRPREDATTTMAAETTATLAETMATHAETMAAATMATPATMAEPAGSETRFGIDRGVFE